MASYSTVPRRHAAGHAGWDALFVALSVAHAAALVAIPSVPLVAIGLWWNANTISHNFIHRPFFGSRVRNGAYSIWLSVVLGVPQSLWRARHLRHHEAARGAWASNLGAANAGGRAKHPRGLLVLESAAIAVAWGACAVIAFQTFVTIVLPGYMCGLALCVLQGHFEHAGGTTSHYGRLYNALFFNDGYHVEHHRRPGAHWTELRSARAHGTRESRWPPVLRWLDALTLDALERVVLRSPMLQRFVVSRHERACRRLLAGRRPVRSVLVVGGGLFPRTAIVLRKLLPEASITIVDAEEAHLAVARAHVDAGVHLIRARFDAHFAVSADLVVVPLAYRGDRRRIYAKPPAPLVFVHDWIWSRGYPGTSISWLLCKRLNCVSQQATAAS